jgi:shikimate kinase
VDNYILIGLPNCGKSTLGRRAAEILGVDFYDTDVLARERAEGKRRFVPMSMAFAAAFTEEEENVVVELARNAQRSVIATGSGTPLGAFNAYILKKMGIIVYIERDPDVIIADMRENKRPSLILEHTETHETINMREFAVTQYAENCPDYEAIADVVLDNNGGEDAGVEKLVKIIEKYESQRKSSKQKNMRECHP